MTNFKLTHGNGHTYNIAFAVHRVIELLQEYKAYKGGKSSEDGVTIFSTLTEKDKIKDVMIGAQADGVHIIITDEVQKNYQF